jgi:hypothetical protein
MLRRGYITVILFVFITTIGYTQLTSSPYSIFAAGQMESSGFGVVSSMGGTGIAMSSDASLNAINPASYMALDSTTFLFEVGLFGKYSTFQSKNKTINKTDGNLKYLALGFRINKWWAASAGLLPYSAVSYSIDASGNIDGLQIRYPKVYSGSGGINRMYFGSSFKPVKNLSLGINASYLFGTIVQSESAPANYYFDAWSIDKTRYLHDLYLDYGLQYTIRHKDMNYRLGVILGTKKKLNTRDKFDVSYLGDTVNLDNSFDNLYIPAKYGFGLAVEKANRYRIGVDYENNQWSSIKLSNSLAATRNSERFSAGIEFTPTNKGMDPGLRNLQYRLGANYTKSYLVVDNVPINSMSVTFGIGMPLRRDLSKINISLEYGQNGTTRNDLIFESYWLLHLNVSLHDTWFRRARFD